MCKEYREFREMQKTKKNQAVGKKAKKECKIDDKQTIETVYLQIFIFSFIWSAGGNLDDDTRDKFSKHLG